MTAAKKLRLAILCFRWCVALTLLSAVADRLGFWGPNGSKYASWGDWQHFVAYSSMLNWYLPAALQNPMAIIATALEAAFAILLILGLQTRYAALGAGVLFTLFAIAMSTAGGIKSPLNFSVFVDAAGAFLLVAIVSYQEQDAPLSKQMVRGV